MYIEPFELYLIKKECFPKLHIINYEIEINTDRFESLFPENLISIIDTIRINRIDSDEKEEIAIRLDNLAYTSSIHINTIDISIYDLAYYFPHLKELLEKNLITFDYLDIDSSRSENIKVLDCIENYKQNIDNLYIKFNDDDQGEINITNSLERFFKTNILEHINYLDVSFNENISIEYLKLIPTIFNNNKFNTIHKLKIYLHIKEDSSSEYLTIYENILEKIISKASIVSIRYCTMTFINRLIPKSCFHNTTQLFIDINDIPDDDFLKPYTTDNLPQLKYIKIYINKDTKWWSSFIKAFNEYIHKNNYQLSSTFEFIDCCYNNSYIYHPNS
ncbi:hypothetical protein WA158_005969 [Blastocystis sp. Blastoise]